MTPPKQEAEKARQPWKPKIEKINIVIANEGNFVQMNKFYDLYNKFEKDQIDISTLRHIIVNNLSMKDIKGVVN